MTYINMLLRLRQDNSIADWQIIVHVANMKIPNATPIELIDEWLATTGTLESRLGLLACANARAVERVRRGSASVATQRALIAYITDHPTKQSACRG